MSNTVLKWEEVGIANDFMFGKVMQDPEICKRLLIDLQLLDKGESYRKLNRSYVIFICAFDLFGAGLHMYEFENICVQDTDIRLGDGTAKIFLNETGTADDVGEDLKAFLNYVAGNKSENDFVQKLEEAVAKARKNREWRHEYMTLAMRDQENIERGR